MWWPLNVMYLLLVCAGLKWLYQKKPKYTLLISVLFALVLGALVEWWWFGILIFIAADRYCNKRDLKQLVFFACSILLLYLINQNYYAMLAIPIIYVADHLPIKDLPRIKHLFYWVYPGHLLALLLIKTVF